MDEILLDDYADFEEEDESSEDIGAHHFRRIQAFPLLTDAEERDLLQLWCEFRDEKVGDQIVEAHMRMVPPIARDEAVKAGFEPNYNMLPTAQRCTAATGFAEVVSDLTAAGNLGLVQALEGYQLGNDVKFYTYARKCVRREVWKQATFLRSVVRRKDGSTAKFDLSIDPLMPDVPDALDYVGSRAKSLVSIDSGGTDRDWVTAKASHSRLRPQPEEPITLNLRQLPKDERRIIKARMNGLKLHEIAKELEVSIATIWRKEKAAIARIRHERDAYS